MMDWLTKLDFCYRTTGQDYDRPLREPRLALADGFLLLSGISVRRKFPLRQICSGLALRCRIVRFNDPNNQSYCYSNLGNDTQNAQPRNFEDYFTQKGFKLKSKFRSRLKVCTCELGPVQIIRSD